MAYKEQQLTKPEVRLESEINLLKMEKVRFVRIFFAFGTRSCLLFTSWRIESF